MVATVYRIRWQIALVFKHWKSLFHLHVLKGTRPERIRCLLYGRLITITLLMRVCSSAAWYASVVCRREVSFPKLLLWLKRKGRFARAVQDGTMETLYADLRQAMEPLLCKQKRKRQTSYQLLDVPVPDRESETPRKLVREDQAASLDAYGLGAPMPLPGRSAPVGRSPASRFSRQTPRRLPPAAGGAQLESSGPRPPRAVAGLGLRPGTASAACARRPRPDRKSVV